MFAFKCECLAAEANNELMSAFQQQCGLILDRLVRANWPANIVSRIWFDSLREDGLLLVVYDCERAVEAMAEKWSYTRVFDVLLLTETFCPYQIFRCTDTDTPPPPPMLKVRPLANVLSFTLLQNNGILSLLTSATFSPYMPSKLR